VIVVSDSTVLIGLAKIGKLSLLRQLFSRINIPEEVRKEIAPKGKAKPGSREIRESKWILAKTVKDQTEVNLLLGSLDKGEAEVLVLAKQLKASKRPVILSLNKIDRIEDKATLLEMIASWSTYREFAAVVPISAVDGTQVDKLIDAIIKILPEGPPYFSEDTLTDATERFLAAELIREKIFQLTGEEIPYASAVTIEAFKSRPDGRQVTIEATIHLERDSQKGIVIGRGGAMLKRIGTEARQDIEQMTGARVLLKLFVRVQKNWRKDVKAIERFGY